MAVNPVCWFEIYVQDMDRAKKFYETVFQFQLMRLDGTDMDMWGFPMTAETDAQQYGSSGSLVKRPDVPSGGNSVLVYFSCEDCAAETARVAAAGGKVHLEKQSIGKYGFISLAVDTEGNLIGLHSLK